jgi:ribA/ribD-fused uncharacterized protein
MSYRSIKEGADRVIILNEQITDLMRKKSEIEFPLRWTAITEKEVTRNILFEEEHETRKLKHEIYYLKRRTKTLQDEYVREYDPATEVIEPTHSSSRESIIFNTKEDEHGFLSDEWLVTFTLDGVQYSSALQAYMANKANFLDKPVIRSLIMATRSVKVIRRKSEPLLSTEEWNKGKEEILYKIQFAKFSQHPDLEKLLIETGDKKLIYANESDIGTGIAADDPRIENTPSLLGKVLQRVRAKLREGAEGAAGGPVKEKAITEAEETARTKAIISRRTAIKRG